MADNSMTGAVAVGVVVGGSIAARRYFKNLRERTNDASDDADDALTLGRSNAGAIRALRDAFSHGDLVRLQSDRVNDLHVGLAYGSPLVSSPSAVATFPQVQPRPSITEAQILAHQVWPNAVNSYNADGLLIYPDQAFSASNLAQVGLALGFGEVAAALGGLGQPTEPSAAQQAQIFRFFRALGGGAVGKQYTPQQWDRIIAALLTLPVAQGPSGGLLYAQQARAPGNIGASGAEEFAPAIVLPQGSFPIGRTLKIKIGWYLPSANGANTVRFGLRWGSSGGPLIYFTTAVDPANGGDSATIEINLIRQPDSPTGYPVIVGSGISMVGFGVVGVGESLMYAQAAPAGPVGPGGLDGSIVLVPSILFSAANAANLGRVEFATVELQ